MMKKQPQRGGPPAAVFLIGFGVLIMAVVLVAVRGPGSDTPKAESPTLMSPPPKAANGPAPVIAKPAAPAPGTSAARSPEADGGANSPDPHRTMPPANAAGINPSDLPPDHPAIAQDESTQITLQWLGHSCFYIQSPGKVGIVTDPFDPNSTGLSTPNIGAHLVTISSDGPEHNYAAGIHPFQSETEPGKLEPKQVLFGVSKQFKDTLVTSVRLGEGNYAYVIQAGTLRVAHLGTLRELPTPTEVKALGAVDILLIPVGGGRFKPKDAVELTRQIAPRIAIPMSYSAPGMDGPDAKLPPVDAFIAASPFAVTNRDINVMSISKPELPTTTEIYTLPYQR